MARRNVHCAMPSTNYQDLIAWQKAMTLAEGEGRRTDGEFLNQLSVAHGSVRELETHVMLAGRLRFIGTEVTAALLAQLGEVGRLINGLAKSLSR